MSHRLSTLAAGCVTASLVCMPAVMRADQAPPRFEVLQRESLGTMSGLTVYTVRDNMLAACYVLFVVDPPPPQSEALPPEPPTPAQFEKIRVAEALIGAAARRDSELAKLPRQVQPRSTINYEAGRQRIEQEYQQDVRSVLLDVNPTAQIAPGWPTTSLDAMNEAVRRAIAEALPAVKGDRPTTGTDDAERPIADRIDLTRLAVAGPDKCPAAPPR